MIIIVCGLVFVGLAVMFSASFPKAYYNYGDGLYFFKRQGIFALAGLAAMYGLSHFDFRLYNTKPVAWLAILASIGLLLLVEVMGTTLNGAKRWLNLGPISFQPSELVKVGVVVFTSYWICRVQKHFHRPFKAVLYVLPVLGLVGIICLLMLRQPHLSGTILILVATGTLILVGGFPLIWIALGGVTVAGGLAYIVNFTDYQSARIQMWQHPESDPLGGGFQILQSLYAIGSGGLFGFGLGNGRQKYLYLPEPQNDFVFAVACEELGFVGAVVIIVLFLLLAWRGYVIAMRCKDRFGSLLVIGIITLVSAQALLNIAVATNTIPVTGISLPFFSYGGTSLMILLAQMGIVLNVSRFSYVQKD